MRLEVIPGNFAVCRLATPGEAGAVLGTASPVFLAATGDEISLVCPSPAVPPQAAAVEGDWALLKVAGPLDFGLTGVIAGLSTSLAEAGIPVFVVSTYLTDYILVKANRLPTATEALQAAGHTVDTSSIEAV